jgi:hypothetical protein
MQGVARAFTTGTDLLSFNQMFTAGPNTLTYVAQAQSFAGSLHASASATFSRTLTDSRLIYASSLFREVMTVDSATLDGQPGKLTLTYNIHGNLAESGNGHALAYVILGAGTETDPEEYGEDFFVFASSASGPVTVNDTVTLEIDIVYGRQFLLTTGLGAFAGNPQLCPACPLGIKAGPTTGIGEGSAGFFNSLNLTSLTPTFQNQFVGDAQFLGESGTQYSFNGVVTPEPGSLILLGSGLAMGLHRLRRRRSSTAPNL